MQAHKKYLTIKEKLEAVEFAKAIPEGGLEENGNRKAARTFNVDESEVRRWRKHEDLLKATPKDRRSAIGRGRKAHHPELEAELAEWHSSQRAAGHAVNTVDLRRKALEIARQRNIENFHAGLHWVNNFMHRKAITIRASTHVGQRLPKDWEGQSARFMDRVHEGANGVRLKNIINMDETSCTFDMPRKRTTEKKGAKEVVITTTGHEKSSFTVALAIQADGNKLPPMVIFKRKTTPTGQFPTGLIVKANEKGWMTTPMLKEWIDMVLLFHIQFSISITFRFSFNGLTRQSLRMKRC